MQLPEGMRSSVPVALATVSIGLTFGVLAAPVIGPWAAVAASVLVWAGGAQFAALGVLAGGGAAVTAAATGIVANARYLPMGFAIAPATRGSRWRRALTGLMLTDASLVIGRGDDGRFDVRRLVWAAPLQYLSWVLSTAVGAFAASAIGDPDRLGLDALFPVFFLGLLLPELRRPSTDAADPRSVPRHRRLAAALVAAALALVLVPLTPVGIPVLAGVAVALVGLLPPATPGASPGDGARRGTT